MSIASTASMVAGGFAGFTVSAVVSRAGFNHLLDSKADGARPHDPSIGIGPLVGAMAGATGASELARVTRGNVSNAFAMSAIGLITDAVAGAALASVD